MITACRIHSRLLVRHKNVHVTIYQNIEAVRKLKDNKHNAKVTIGSTLALSLTALYPAHCLLQFLTTIPIATIPRIPHDKTTSKYVLCATWLTPK